MARITFLGATGCVTGSKFLVEADGERLLVDCGLFQGSKELRLRNWDRLPVDPASIEHVILTHAHIDHTGYLPRLVRDGFDGTVYANAPTTDLCRILLPDSARLQEEDAEHAAFKKFSKHAHPEPLYTEEEAHAALAKFVSIPHQMDTQFPIGRNFLVRLYAAGHILGSSSIELEIRENGKSTTVLFSGDIGRYDQPILRDPEHPPRADYLVCESTYGNREHPSGSPYDALTDALTRVAQRGGQLVIPSFAVGRTQTLLYVLRQLEEYQRIPRLPVYVDSPMAISATDMYLRHKYDHDMEFQREAAASGKNDPLHSKNAHMTRSRDESRQINNVKFPCVIISASGMATGGRILYHLAKRLPDDRNAVILAGFQAEGTRGRALLEGAQSLRIHGEEVPVRAEVIHMSQFSAHAGRSELLRWLKDIPAPPRQTFLVHGEPSAARGLADAISADLHWPVSIPKYKQSFDL
jgi:metallo-beta-lactamase family protein